MAHYYLHQGQVLAMPTPLREDNYLISTDEALQETHYVSITAERAKEIGNTPIAALESSISNEELRKQAYEQEADQYLIAYQGYMLEGDVEKAEEQRELYLQKKEEIRAIYSVEE